MNAFIISGMICGTFVTFMVLAADKAARDARMEMEARNTCVQAGGNVILTAGSHHCIRAHTLKDKTNDQG
jgi:hypothetical protein